MSACRLCDVVAELVEICTTLREIRGPKAIDGHEVRSKLREIDHRLRHAISALGAVDTDGQANRPIDPDDLHEEEPVFTIVHSLEDEDGSRGVPCYRVRGLAALREAVGCLEPGVYEILAWTGAASLTVWGDVQVRSAREWLIESRAGLTMGPGCTIV